MKFLSNNQFFSCVKDIDDFGSIFASEFKSKTLREERECFNEYMYISKVSCDYYLGPKDGCVQRTSGPVCCTYDILDSYAKSLEIELKLLVDAELNRLSHVLLSSKQQIEGQNEFSPIFISFFSLI